MGFLAPAIPWAIKGGAALGGLLKNKGVQQGLLKGGAALAGGLFSKKSQANAQKRSPEEQVALTGAQGAASNLASTGQGLVQTGQETQQPATSYYDTLLRGNRARMSQATAAPRAAITDVYRGAERSVERSGVQGAAKDVQTGELNRQRASQLSSLVTGVQPAAADALTGIGQTQIQQGAPMMGQAGSIYSNLLPQGAENRMYAREEGEKTGSKVGGFLFDIISGIGGKGGGKKPLPSRSIAPNMGWLPPSGGGF